MAPQDQRLGIPQSQPKLPLGPAPRQASDWQSLLSGSPGSVGQFLPQEGGARAGASQGSLGIALTFLLPTEIKSWAAANVLFLPFSFRFFYFFPPSIYFQSFLPSTEFLSSPFPQNSHRRFLFVISLVLHPSGSTVLTSVTRPGCGIVVFRVT